MDLVKTIKEGLKIALGLAALNQGLVVISFPAGMLEYQLFSNKIVLDENKLKKYGRLPADFNVLDYLNLANSLVVSELQEKKLSEKKDCEDDARATYGTYSSLIYLNNRTDLNEKVNIAAGITRNEGHVILEYEDFNKVVPYETTAYTPPLNIGEVKDYSKTSKSQKTKGIEIILTRSTKDGNFFYPTLESFYLPGGALRIAFNVVYKQTHP